MIKNNLKINNPLTLIALFSMLTETSAAVSLPYIDSQHQELYIWFLIIFPLLLITLFFLTLNFNNKTLYTPTDLSKSKTPHIATPSTPRPHAEQSVLLDSIFTHANLPIKNYYSSMKYSPYNYTFLPQDPIIYDPHPSPASEPEITPATSPAKSHVLIENTEFKNLQLIDLSHQQLHLPHEITLEDVLLTYHKATQKYENNHHKHNVLLLLTNKQSNIPPEAVQFIINKHKHAFIAAHTTIISYNTGTRSLQMLHSP